MYSRDLGTSKVVTKWMELHFDRGVPCQVHITGYLVQRYAGAVEPVHTVEPVPRYGCAMDTGGYSYVTGI